YATDVEFEINQDDIWNQKLKENKFDFVFFSKVEEGINRINISGQMVVLKDLSQIDTEILTAEDGNYLFDLSGLEKIDSFGTQKLEELLKRIQDEKGKAAAFGANATLRELFSLMGVDNYLELFPNEEEAVKYINGEE
ncbi:MAG: STAS domain-containing protein, partial [Fibrobacterota bacterium]